MLDPKIQIDNILHRGFVRRRNFVHLGLEMLRGDFGVRCPLLEGLAQDLIKNINAVISLWQAVMRLEERLLDTLKLVAKQGCLTAAELTTILA